MHNPMKKVDLDLDLGLASVRGRKHQQQRIRSSPPRAS